MMMAIIWVVVRNMVSFSLQSTSTDGHMAFAPPFLNNIAEGRVRAGKWLQAE